MKFFAVIMALIVMAQSILPCGDGAVGVSKEVKQTITSTHNHSDTKADACSPFCQCCCCAGFSVNHLLVSVNAISPAISKHANCFLLHNITQVILPVWQPPRSC
jgi:hypothetical protein